jgi:hypothetical protein
MISIKLVHLITEKKRTNKKVVLVPSELLSYEVQEAATQDHANDC